ncbi:hypothetical protein NDU88_007803 [Pleurodeles waltl]|uniref:Uncharacterized protein n=1 Tax=Pleurodeles waltl TaxID=8319 RepID=A0AAV7QPV6_PLEWA|nr:hypothetical protein NDU88_007803 [Pleurodeles waltl]
MPLASMAPLTFPQSSEAIETIVERIQPSPQSRAIPQDSLTLVNARDKLEQSTRKMFEVILSKIKDLKAKPAQEMEALHNHLAKIKEVMGKVPSRLKEAEDRISNLKYKVETMQWEVTQLKKSERLLEDKLHDLENYNRCSNLRIVGVPEEVEGKKMPDWVDTQLKKAIPELTCSMPSKF